MKKKILSILTALSLCLSLLPTATLAAGCETCVDEDGDYYCDICWEAMAQECIDEDGSSRCDKCGECMAHKDENQDHTCDECWATLSECSDEDHDHWCNICGAPTYYLDDDWTCDVDGCSAEEVMISGDYTALSYRESEDEVLADGTVEVTALVRNLDKYLNDEPFDPADGTVTIFWIDEDGNLYEEYTLEDQVLTGGKAIVSVSGLPVDLLHHGQMLYKPADPDVYMPSSNGVVLKYQDNAYKLDVDSAAEITINGVNEERLYFLAGTQVTVALAAEIEGTCNWVFDEEETVPEYQENGLSITFIMPEGDVCLAVELTCTTCADENDDHWCDVCGEAIYPSAGELNVDAEFGDGQVTVTWSPLAGQIGEDALASYTVYIHDSENQNFEDAEKVSFTPDNCIFEHTFTSLTNDVEYDVGVEAVYTLGHSLSNSISGVPISASATVPGMPEIQSITYGDGSITVNWTAPEDNGGALVREYTVSVDQEKDQVNWGITTALDASDFGDAEVMSYTVDGLTNGESYTVSVSAKNAVGHGEPDQTEATIPLIPYKLIVGGVQVTEENMNDVLGDDTVTFDPKDRVLKLNNADISVTDGNYGIDSAIKLTIELIGENNLSCTGFYGLLSRDALTICGEGTLDVFGSDFGIYTFGHSDASLTICGNAVVNAVSGDVASGNSFGIRSTGSLTVSENATVTAIGGGAPGTSYGIYAGADFTACDNTKVTANGGKGAEASIGIYIYDPFVVSGNSVVTARADESAGRSCGTYPLERLDLLDSAVLDTAGSKAGNDSYGMRATDISVNGGTLIATGGEGVYDSLGIHTQGFEIFGGSVSTNAGPASFGPSLGLRVAKILSVSGGELTATGSDAPAGASCGIYVGGGMTVEAGTVKAVSGSALEYAHGIETDSLTVTGGEVTAQAVAATGEEGYSWGIQAYNGLSMTGGRVAATGGSAGSRSYGVQSSGAMSITGGNLKAASGRAGEQYAVWSFEEMTLDSSLAILVPAQGKKDNSGEWYWTISDAGGNSALRVEIGTPAVSGGGGGSSAPVYVPTVERTENGSVSVTPKYPNKGDKVTIKTAPKAGYMVADIVVTDKKGNEVKLTNNGDGTYCFTQPAGKVTIDVEFVPERCLSDDYTDLDPEAWYHEAVDYVLLHGLMTGVGEGKFAPGLEMSRNMFVTILWSLESKPVVNYAMSFNDVPADSWYTEAVRWAASLGIVSGYGNGGFGAEDTLTREQLASVLWSYAKYKGIDVSVGEDTNILSYNDAFDISEYAIPAMQWACGAGVINGKDCGILDPKGPATRAEGAQMLMCYLRSQDS